MNLPKIIENGALARSKTGLFWLGMLLAVIGLAAMTTEFYRTFTDIQPSIRWNYVWLAFLPFAIGALLVYTLNPMRVIDKALDVVEQAAPLLRTRLPGGDRYGVDPPATNEHEIQVAQEVKKRRRHEP